MLIEGTGGLAWQGKCAVWISVLASCLIAHPVAAENVPCNNPNVEVSAETAEIRDEVCIAAALAINFLSDYGLSVKHPVRISVVEQPLNHFGYSAYGSYDRRKDLVQVMSPRAIHQTTPAPEMYYQAIDRVQYRGIVAHEVAHAMIEQNSQVSPLPIGQSAQEYLATVTQLAVMPREVRDRIISAAAVGPWESGDVISGVYMAMAPERFAVKCYLHFQRYPAPAEFVEELLRSKWFYVNVE